MRKTKVVIFLFLSAACSENTIQNTCADPIGSEDKSLNDKSIICFKEDFNDCFQIRYSSSLNQITSVAISGGEAATIVDFGAVNCLGEVTTKPSTGFSPDVAIVRGHGYVIKLPDNTFGRLYIESAEDDAGINITWQYSF